MGASPIVELSQSKRDGVSFMGTLRFLLTRVYAGVGIRLARVTVGHLARLVAQRSISGPAQCAGPNRRRIAIRYSLRQGVCMGQNWLLPDVGGVSHRAVWTFRVSEGVYDRVGASVATNH